MVSLFVNYAKVRDLIIGIGTDLCWIERIEQMLKRWGERFERRVFTEEERDYCHRRSHCATHFAARFAAKEACFKALGTGLSSGVHWKDAEVRREAGQAPQLALSGNAALKARELGVIATHLSLTHDSGLALAFVVLEGHQTGEK